MSARRILVVGGSGLIGATAAATLADRGDEVTVASRRAASDEDPPSITGMPRIVGDYAAGGLSERELEDFDAVVMAAGQDIRHVAASEEGPDFWRAVQSAGVPGLAARAKRAGVGRFVQVGSYYHQLMPELADSIPYVAARRAADDGARALTGDGFAAVTLNPPSIVGAATECARRRFLRMAQWLRGEAGEPRPWAPPGGTNYMSVDSLAQAIVGALDRGEPGRAYLLGDESLSYRDYFQLFVDLTGGANRIEVGDAPNPMQPDRFIVQGRGATIEYEPAADDVALLGYDRHDVISALAEILSRR